jgi:hypothetical protein
MNTRHKITGLLGSPENAIEWNQKFREDQRKFKESKSSE